MGYNGWKVELNEAKAEIARLEEGLARLATPLAFGTPSLATPEDQARMVFAQAVLDGKAAALAEKDAEARIAETNRH